MKLGPKSLKRKHSLKHTKNLKEGPCKRQMGAIYHSYSCQGVVLLLWRYWQEEEVNKEEQIPSPSSGFTVSHWYLLFAECDREPAGKRETYTTK